MKLNLRRLETIAITLKAIQQIDQVMEWYKDTTKAGPVYLSVKAPPLTGIGSTDVQVDREPFLEFMQARKDYLIQHLEDRFEGFQYDLNASWHGDAKEEDSAS
jgi:hypothetical protein